MEIKKYRLGETGIEVEAVYLHPRDTNPDEVAAWCGGEVFIPEGKNFTGGPLEVRFTDDEGTVRTVGKGNYLVKRPDIGFFSRSESYFETLYIPVGPEDPSTRLPSSVWSDLFGVTILDPDGWDRKNFDQSWTEYITEEEFIRRSGPSTMGMRHGLTEPPVLPYFWDILPHA